MKISNYSLNYSDLIARGEMDVFRFLGLCRAMALEGASLHLGNLADTKTETLARVRRAFLDQGLSVAMVTVSTDFGRPADRLGAEFDRARAAIQAAAFLGAPLLRVFAGSAPQGTDRPSAWARAVDHYRRVCEEAAAQGLPIGLQNHNHGGLCGTGADVVRFAREVNHPNLTAVLDCGQFVGSPGASSVSAGAAGQAELLASIRQTAPLARHVRVKFYRPRADGSEPGIPYDQVFDILRAVHYPGFLDIVYEPARPGGEAAQAAIPRIVSFLRLMTSPAKPTRAN
jgi:sugar phosphate isomerase/epimerase